VTSDGVAIGTRASPLALAQAALVREALARQGHRSRVVTIVTEGDRRAPDTPWGEGAFVTAIERALLDGRVDLAVHSAKDVPTGEEPALSIGAYLPRADPRDALVVREGTTDRSLEELAAGCRVGTDSPRRAGFIRARRPDLVVHPLHGNVDTRLRRLDDGETDALALACAGLDRLGLGARIAQRLAPEVVPPAPGQGAIAVQVRADDRRTRDILAGVDDDATRATVEAERAFLIACGGGCRTPIGALAAIVEERLVLLGGYADPEGSWVVVESRDGPLDRGTSIARGLARAMGAAVRLRGDGGRRTSAPPKMAPRVLVTRAGAQAGPLVDALRDVGVEPVVVPTIEVDAALTRGELEAAVRALDRYSWVVVTSANGARAIVAAVPSAGAASRPPRWAVIGSATAKALEAAGIAPDMRASRPNDRALGLELPAAAGDRVLVVRGDLADGSMPATLRARGAVVDEVIAYRTREAPESSRETLRRALHDGPFAAVVFSSGSTVRGLVALASAANVDVARIGAVCIGPSTAEAARMAGFEVLAVADEPSAMALAAATATALSSPSETIA
jgi:hydroxymethylbilane synthase